ncbi:hypothetical protein HanRHA438_Chr01g0003271 [Helianthus annuus]|nr:hypothetical protein HanRHA438_Chr01g0003271 [Helianthus annuus]KAJ0955444.1 hypothetical protein HanPSC8_Chr01g0002951 [Helianthus annuus]
MRIFDAHNSLVEKAKRKAALSNSCWQNAYQNLFNGCSEILAREEQRSRLAWHLSDCFQKDTGRPHFPYCDVKSPMVNCLKKLDEDRIYLEFYLQTNAIGHHSSATVSLCVCVYLYMSKMPFRSVRFDQFCEFRPKVCFSTSGSKRFEILPFSSAR